MTIRKRLLLAFFCSLFSCCAVICCIVFLSMKHQAFNAFEALSQRELQHIEDHIDTFLAPGFMGVRFLARQEEIRDSFGKLSSFLHTTQTTTLRFADQTPFEQGIYRRMLDIHKGNSNFGLVFMANKDGQYLQAPEGGIKLAGYDPRERSWYKELMASGSDEVVSTPYLTTGGGMVCSIMKKTYTTRGEPLGMVGIDYSLESLTSDLVNRKILSTGYVVLYNAAGETMVDGFHPEYVGRKIEQLPLLRQQAIREPDGVFFGRGESGRDLYCVTKTIDVTRWKIAIFFDEQEILRPSYTLLLMTLACVAVASLLSFLAVMRLGGAIVKPIEELVAASKMISDKEYETSPEVRERLYQKLHTKTWGETKVLAEALTTVIKTLQERVEAALAASKAKTAFLANTSHEIRTPMNAIVGLTRMLLRSPLDERQLSYAENIRRAAVALLGLINGILDFTSIESGKMQLKKSPFNPVSLLEDLRVFFQEQSVRTGIALRIEQDADLPMSLLGDIARLRQILINLVDNAFKFTEKGSVTVGAKLVQKRANTADLVFSVADTGIGMNQSQLDDVLTVFSQADGSATRKYGVVGLGLTVTSRLVSLMGGSLDISSEEGKGSVFTVAVSFEIVAPQIEETPQGGEPIPEMPLDGLRVLVVEDNEINMLIVVEVLNAVGAQVIAANNGQEALDRIDQALAEGHNPPFDLVFMDLQMPVMDGHEATKRIRKHPICPHLPVYALTAHAFDEERRHCMEIGMNGHLTKPVDPPTIYETMRSVAQRKATAETA